MPRGKRVADTLKPGFQRDHVARREPFLVAPVPAQRDQLGAAWTARAVSSVFKHESAVDDLFRLRFLPTLFWRRVRKPQFRLDRVLKMNVFHLDRGFSYGQHHVWHDLRSGSCDALLWLQSDPNAPWTVMFYERHEPDILHVIESNQSADLVDKAWMMNRLYVIFSSIRDAAMFKLRFNGVPVNYRL